MTTAQDPAPRIDLSRRDLTLDLARVFCVLVVVAIHLLFVGVGADAAGGISVSRPIEEQSWFAGATWVGQIMPLFFVVGGFATITSLRSHRHRIPDRTEADRSFAHGRMQRLARPALPLFLFLAVALLGAAAAGIDPGLVGAVAAGVGSPLWFLGAYLLCQLLAPALLARHERAPRATLAVLLAGVVLVDVVRFAWTDGPVDSSGAGAIGYLNLLFVWPLVHQLGFWYADGWFARRAGWQLVLIAVACWASLVPLTVWGPYSTDMLTNLNPPTLPLVVLGLGQAALLQLLKPPLTALMRTGAARGVVYVVGSRLMTIYLWHVPIIVALAGLGLLLAFPGPESAVWWWTRPVVYLVVLGLLVLLSLGLGRFERPLPVERPASAAVLGVAGALAIVPVLAITILGLNAWLALAGAIGYLVAVLLLRTGQMPKSTSPKSPASSAASAGASPDASSAVGT